MNIKEARNRWREAQSRKLGDEMMAFAELSRHPDCEWQDLLNALERPNSIGDDAWLQLRVKLKAQIGIEGAVRRDRAFWESALQQKGVTSSSKCAG